MTHSSDETITACPKCDSSDIHARVSSFVDTDDKRSDTETPWYCNACGEGFHEPRRRERKTDATPGYHGPAADLIDADPDEFP